MHITAEKLGLVLIIYVLVYAGGVFYFFSSSECNVDNYWIAPMACHFDTDQVPPTHCYFCNHATSLPDPGLPSKYIWMDSNPYGFHNQRQQILTAIWLAYLGNMCVVLNSRTAHEHNSVVARLDRYWNISHLARVVRVQVASDWAPPGHSQSTAKALDLFDRAEVAVSPAALTDPAEKQRVQALIYGQKWRTTWPTFRDIETEMGQNSEDLRLMNTFIWLHEYFLLSEPVMDQLHEIEKYFLRYNDEIFDLGKAAAAWLGPYSSVHNRGGGIRLNEVRQPPFEEIIPSYLGPGEVLYVATNVHTADEDTLKTLERLRKVVSVVTLDDVRAAGLWQGLDLHEGDPDYLACVEQVILAHGRLFWPTARSSYSDYIVSLRQFMNVPTATLEKVLWKDLVLKS